MHFGAVTINNILRAGALLERLDNYKQRYNETVLYTTLKIFSLWYLSLCFSSWNTPDAINESSVFI